MSRTTPNRLRAIQESVVRGFSGTYVVVAFLVMQRTREFGIRIALGATTGRIVSRIPGEALQTAALGISAGLVMAAGLAQVFSGTIPIIPEFSVLPRWESFARAIPIFKWWRRSRTFKDTSSRRAFGGHRP
jgi:ABC-type antimicrobial peptide transport system permease subunit